MDNSSFHSKNINILQKSAFLKEKNNTFKIKHKSKTTPNPEFLKLVKQHKVYIARADPHVYDDMPKLDSCKFRYCIWCCREITDEPKQKHKNCENRPSGALPY